MEFLEGRDLFGSGPSKEIPCLTGKGEPTTAKVGAVGCLYMDTDTGALYKCIKAENGVYTWTQEAGLYYTPVVTQPSDTTMKIAFQPSVSGAPIPAPVVVELPTGSSDSGENGNDGFSPIATVKQTADGAVITITDKNGTTTATVTNGKDGVDGAKGDKGDTGPAGADGAKGEKGDTGAQGPQGEQGPKGDTGAVGPQGIQGETGATGPAGADGKDYTFDPTVYGLPVLWLTGDTAPIAVSKDNKVTLNYAYGERSGTCTAKGQGATSYKTAQALVNAGKAGKFNYTINFDTAFEAKEGWGAQKKYCFKGNFIDPTQSRNVCSCKQWGMIVKSRSSVPAELANLPNGGAIDGFPCIIMLNGEFHGLYTWNIPKDGWMFGMVESTTMQQAIVAAKDHTAATQFKEASLSGFEVEFVSDESNADWVETSLTRMISAVMNSDGSDLDTTVAQYLDWDSAIDYYAHIVADKATDCVDKNYLLATFDGTKWYFSDYDRDSIHGLNWDASGLTRPVSNVTFQECAESVRVFELIYRFKTDQLKARCNELLANILSESRTMQIFENFAWAIPLPVMVEDVKRYPTILGSGVNTIDQIGRFVRQRRETMVKWINAFPAQETPPTTEPDEPSDGYTNLVPTSTDTDGSIYNGTGYKDDVRLSSSGGVSSTAQNGSVTTGFIPFTPGSTIRIKGAEFLGNYGKHDGHYYVNFYDANKGFTLSVGEDSIVNNIGSCFEANYDEETGISTIKLLKGVDSDYGQKIDASSFFRLTAYGNGEDLIVTVNQEITE